MTKGRWDPDASTATAYAWFVWAHDDNGQLVEPKPPLWIPPGRRKALSKTDDRLRFAAWSLGSAPLFDGP